MKKVRNQKNREFRLALVLGSALAMLALPACDSGTSVSKLSSGGGTAPTPVASSAPSVPTAPTTGSLYTGPAELEKYVQKFVDDAKAQGVDVLPNMKNPTLEIQFGSLAAYGSSVIGLCETSGNLRRVTFSTTFWNAVDETQRELLAHHELGHCVLYRAHKTTLLASGAYASIMYPIIMASSTYTGNYAYYQQELFGTSSASALEVDPNAVTVHVCGPNGL